MLLCAGGGRRSLRGVSPADAAGPEADAGGADDGGAGETQAGGAAAQQGEISPRSGPECTASDTRRPGETGERAADRAGERERRSQEAGERQRQTAGDRETAGGHKPERQIRGSNPGLGVADGRCSDARVSA